MSHKDIYIYHISYLYHIYLSLYIYIYIYIYLYIYISISLYIYIHISISLYLDLYCIPLSLPHELLSCRLQMCGLPKKVPGITSTDPALPEVSPVSNDLACLESYEI